MTLNTPASGAPVIEMEHLSFSIGGLGVLEDVTLTVRERDFVCIVGPNAGGKTTLLKLVLGLLRPTAGTVRVFGGIPARSRFRIGYMPQHTSLDPRFPVTVLDVVLMGRLTGSSRFGPYGRKDREEALLALEMLQLAGVRRRSFAELSGGQRQRVLIARALVSSPDLLLLDEPTSNVDAVLETELFELLNRLNERMTIALVSHDLGFVSRYVKRVVCVNRRVADHLTSEITGEMIHEIYGSDVRMVRHDTVNHPR